MDLYEIVKEGGLKISFPKKFRSVFTLLRERGFVTYEEDDLFHAISPTAYGITRTQTKLPWPVFLEFYRSIKVQNGSKSLEVEEETIYLKPKRPKKLSFRVSVPEYKLIRWAARQYLLDVSDYIRMCVLEDANETLARAKKMRETGLV